MKAFLAAAPFARSRYQKPISRKLLRPTPSQPTSKKRKSSASTRMSMEAMNRFMYAKKRRYPSSPRMNWTE